MISEPHNQSTHSSCTHLSGRTVFVVAALLVMAQNCLYGLGNPVSKLAIDAMGVYPFLVVRYVIALVPLLVFFGKRIFTQLRSCPVKVWLGPSICIAFCYVCNNIALGLTAATAVGFFGSLAVIIAPILALILYRTPYPKRNIPILFLLVIGLYMLSAWGGITSFGWGEFFGLMASLLLAFSLVLGCKAMEDIDPIVLTSAQIAISLVVSAVCCVIFGPTIDLSAMTPEVWGITVYMAIGCSVGGFFVQNMALKMTSSSYVTIVQTAGPAMTAAFSFMILGEVLSPIGLVGAAITIACVLATVLLDMRANMLS